MPVLEPEKKTEPSKTAEWAEWVPEAMRTEEFAPIGQKYKTQEEAFKAHAQLTKKVGAMVSIPGDGASPEDVDGFWEKNGWTKDPAKYEALELPEGADKLVNTNQLKTAAKLAHQMRVPLKTAQAIIKQVAASQMAETKAMYEKRDQTVAAYKSKVQEMFQGDMPKVQGTIDRLMENLRKDGLIDEYTALQLQETGLADSPLFYKMAYETGKQYVSDGVERGQAAGGGKVTAETLKAKLREIQKEKKDQSKVLPEEAKIYDQLAELSGGAA